MLALGQSASSCRVTGAACLVGELTHLPELQKSFPRASGCTLGLAHSREDCRAYQEEAGVATPFEYDFEGVAEWQ